VNNVKIDTVILDKLITHAPEMIDKAIRATAFDVEAKAKSLAAVDTGAMRASIFTSTHEESGFDAAGERVIGRNAMVEPVDPTPGKPPLMHAYVAPGVEYAAAVEFGRSRSVSVMGETIDVNIAAQPFLTPAVEKAGESFEKHIKKVFGEIK
jgi:hypothetical protein